MNRVFAGAAVLFGLVTLGVFVSFSMLAEVKAAFSGGRAMADALSLFQRVESVGDLLAVFGGYETSSLRAQAFHAVNTIDLWVFIPAYVLFLSAAAIALGGGFGRPLVWAGIGFALLGGAADVVETSLQLRITADLANAAAHIPIAPWHWLKYGALALNGFVVAGLCLLRTPKRWILAVIALAPLPAVLAAYAGLSPPRLFALSLELYWIALLAVSALGLLRKA